jgi:hypothetical protein
MRCTRIGACPVSRRVSLSWHREIWAAGNDRGRS